ncbi:hypothetical protein GCM10025868_39160 [Angustibacter aerolatus]|uniref:MacB-like periplasmic core domain-containing protein n=1 Tax=Angustibacter aerolatus TaxID=1162965 RepID=A0ABQ6JM80_9ACTN|nr:hypothetical protein GCM10025868_39160 [Angustibacter aerolatus]
MVPAAALAGRAALSRGRLPGGLAAVAVARRPALRRLVAIVTVAVALLVFAAAASGTAADQRARAARARVGAPVVLQAQQTDASTLAAGVRAADPGGRLATPVLRSDSLFAGGPSTLAVDPTSFPRVALWGSADAPGAGAPPLTALAPADVPPVVLRGTRLQVTTVYRPRPFALTPAEEQANGGPVPPGPRAPVRLSVDVVRTDGLVVRASLDVLRRGRHVNTARLPCAQGCRLREVRAARTLGDSSAADVRVDVLGARLDGAPVDLRAASGWAATGEFEVATVTPLPAGGLRLRSRSLGGDLVAHRQDVPVVLPAVVTGDLRAPTASTDLLVDPDAQVTAPDLTGVDAGYRRAVAYPSLPGTTGPGVLVPLAAAGEVDGPLGARTRAQVWVASDDPAAVSALTRRLAARDLVVVGRTSEASVAAELAVDGPALALRLASLVGAVALLLAACVLAVSAASSGRVRALDLAGLRLAGLPQRALVGAAVREQAAGGARRGAGRRAARRRRRGAHPRPGAARARAARRPVRRGLAARAGRAGRGGRGAGGPLRAARQPAGPPGAARAAAGGVAVSRRPVDRGGRWAGLRLALRGIAHRRGTAAVVLALAVVAATAAVLAPLAARAAEQSIARGALTRSDLFGRGVHADVPNGAADRTLPLAATQERLAAGLRGPAYGRQVVSSAADGTTTPQQGPRAGSQVLVPVQERERVCEHLPLDGGRCPTAPGEVATTARSAEPARAAARRPHRGRPAGRRHRRRRAGVAHDAAGGHLPAVRHRRRLLVGPALFGWYPTSRPRGLGEIPPQTDVVLLGAGTAAATGIGAYSVDVPVDGRRLDLAGGQVAAAQVTAVSRELGLAGVAVTSRLPTLVETAQQRSAVVRVAAPLAAVRLVLLAFVVLGHVVAAATQERAPSSGWPGCAA